MIQPACIQRRPASLKLPRTKAKCLKCMFITIFMHSAKMMSTNKRARETLLHCCASSLTWGYLSWSLLHLCTAAPNLSSSPSDLKTKICFCLPDCLLPTKPEPGWALLCTVVYLLEWGALVSYTQRMIWPLRLINYLCWLNHLVNEVSRSAVGSRSCLSVLAPDTDSLGEF